MGWPSPPPWSGELPWMLLRQLLNSRKTNQSLLDMHKASNGDAHLCDYIESEFLDEQVEGIKEISTDHQDEESRTRTWIPHDRQGDRKLNISMFGKTYTSIGSTFGIFQ